MGPGGGADVGHRLRGHRAAQQSADPNRAEHCADHGHGGLRCTGLLSLATVEGLTGTAPWTAATVGGLIFIGVACTAVAYGLFNAGLRTVPSGAASILTLWEPLTAAVLAVVLLGETLSPAALVGSAYCSAR